MQLRDIEKVHFVGVGGIGMSALARLFLHEKKNVSGSDRSISEITNALTKEGLIFFDSQVKENITADIDLVVYTEAMPHDHEELVHAREQGIHTINYFDALGMIANEYYLVAVAGSHGKTTTTAMLIDIFEEAGFDPSAIVGSLRAKTKSNYRAGKSKYFIVEACEYKRDFLSLTPDVLVITNIEHEHVDYYKNLEEVQNAFHEFALRVRESGVVITNMSDPQIIPVVVDLSCAVIDYKEYFDPLQKLTMPGIHNQMNAAATKAVADFVGISKEVSKNALELFAGTWRRFEYKGEVHGAKVYDDYGHHPTEIKATIRGARELYPDRNLVLVFQSHTYSRTHELFNDFVEALGEADSVMILPIYAAREENVFGVSHTFLVDVLKKNNKDAQAFDSFDAVVEHLEAHIGPNDLVLVMGAGDVTQVTKKLETY